MRLQDYTINATREAQQEAFRYAKAVPEDKADWKPMDAGQSVLSMCRELAMCPDWAYDTLAKKELDFSETAQASHQAEMESWTSVAECERACEEKLGRYFELLKGFPEERLAETMDLPFGPGGSMKTFTLAELMDYPRWNCNYHLGQIAYVQTLYGDRDMH